MGIICHRFHEYSNYMAKSSYSEENGENLPAMEKMANLAKNCHRGCTYVQDSKKVSFETCVLAKMTNMTNIRKSQMRWQRGPLKVALGTKMVNLVKMEKTNRHFTRGPFAMLFDL